MVDPPVPPSPKELVVPEALAAHQVLPVATIFSSNVPQIVSDSVVYISDAETEVLETPCGHPHRRLRRRGFSVPDDSDAEELDEPTTSEQDAVVKEITVTECSTLVRLLRPPLTESSPLSDLPSHISDFGEDTIILDVPAVKNNSVSAVNEGAGPTKPLHPPPRGSSALSDISDSTELDENANQPSSLPSETSAPIEPLGSPGLKLPRPGDVPPASSRAFLYFQRVSGPGNVFPAGLRAILKDWHDAHSEKLPPCATRSWSASRLGRFVIFDWDGDELQLAIYKVITHTISTPYFVMVLLSEKGPGELVAPTSIRPKMTNKSLKGHYLLAWLGDTQQWGNEVSAVRVPILDDRKVRFDPKMFDYAQDNPLLLRAITTPKKNKDSSPTDSAEHANVKSRPPHLTFLEPALYAPTPSPITQASEDDERQSPHKTTDQSFWADQTSKRELSEVSSDPSTIRNVRRRLFAPTPTPPSPTTKARFKLVSETSEMTRCFSVEDCENVDVFFKKAREFYRSARKASSMALACQIPGVAGIRYIGEGCQDEFRILCEDIDQLSGGGGILVIDIKPVL
ncbi:hypothetical protein N7510_000694 [Penicillium lagena]|uniref:uncharacterized protein n=1 Tax=Penicillium lagena TaxID=94218 RepID=UPI0025424FB6|nr:uncharacterized protein N7510_000694 [Penicillium lagena]KAJ5624385.1 hypothetical protein N7510_000694 [Penicillium lagena]